MLILDYFDLSFSEIDPTWVAANWLLARTPYMHQNLTVLAEIFFVVNTVLLAIKLKRGVAVLDVLTALQGSEVETVSKPEEDAFARF
ncbi:hypothetical protein KR51_00004510 [Rubidibacter lacunae KORDI 51-2]|uniref:Uncharacterized protein n=1 Tax=Rubidibacter lacunae KORDI 51-2 TaxID=582515 RepID=U5DPN8_9CHRO|nr:hypothetical protein [Rubidibacter lacunae]ERN42832.1 hypothetical protein KR51_00004510 [Rubidibacter lacunae KORDI 51-2]